MAPRLLLRRSVLPRRAQRWLAAGRFKPGAEEACALLRVAVDALGHLVAPHVAPANPYDRAGVGRLAEDVQAIAGGSIDAAFVDQVGTGQKLATPAREHGINRRS